MWFVAVAAIVVLALMRGVRGLKMLAALFAVVILGVMVWNIAVSLLR
jgi:hypothetical protein